MKTAVDAKVVAPAHSIAVWSTEETPPARSKADTEALRSVAQTIMAWPARVKDVAKPFQMRYIENANATSQEVPVPSQATAEHNVLGRSEDFRHFLWRRHLQSASLDGFVPELLATDGHLVRRMISERDQLTFQQFECERTAESIIDAVESHANGGGEICGYSMHSDADALAILHTADRLDAGWVAFPCPASTGRPAGMPTLPMFIDDMPTIRICGGTQLRWKDCHLVLEAAVEQRDEDSGEFAAEALLDHLVGLSLRTTILEEGRAKSVKLPASRQPRAEVRRTDGGRVEATFEIDSAMHRRHADDDSLGAWLVLDFDRRLFCLPSEWCSWWFRVRFPRHIRG